MNGVKDLQPFDLLAMPGAMFAYLQKTFLAGGVGKWIPAALIALVLNLRTAFTELFWIVVLLWLCDFAIGALRAFHDPEILWEWAKAFKSVLKLLVITVGVVAVHLMETLLLHSGLDTQRKLVGAVLIVMGVTEGFSILENFSYFFPQAEGVTSRLRTLLGKARDGKGTRP